MTSDFGRTWGLCFFFPPPGEKAAVLVATGEGLKFLPGNPEVIIFDARKNPVGLFVFPPFVEDRNMEKKRLKSLFLFWLVVALAGCATPDKKSDEPLSQPGHPAKPTQAVPAITQSFASPQISPGSNWKVYFKASDTDGDMKEFVCTIHQPGVGTYPASFTRIKEGNQRELSGYLFLNVSPFRNLDFVDLLLTVQIQDRAGQYSKPVDFPLSINSRYAQEPPPEGVFQENNLGPIMIQLRTVGEDDRPGLFDRWRR